VEKPRGALVANVEDGGPAAKAGLRPGDVIVGFDGKRIESSGELPALVADTRPGASVDMRVLRDGAEKQLKLTVGEMPPRLPSLAAASAESQGKLGVAVRPGENGIVVERADGAAAKAGVRPGDVIVGVNGRPVKTVDELRSAVDAAGKQVALLVQRGEARIFVPVEIG
jgi:serine protease Do